MTKQEKLEFEQLVTQKVYTTMQDFRNQHYVLDSLSRILQATESTSLVDEQIVKKLRFTVCKKLIELVEKI